MEFNTIMSWSKQFALVLFFLFFVGVLFWVMRPGSKEGYERAGRMPLDDDPPPRDPGPGAS